MKMIIGAQLYTVRKRCETLEGLDDALKRCADMGYRAVQLSGVCAYEAEWMAEKLKEYGLVAPITHTNIKRIKNDTEAVIAEHKIFGAGYVGLGSIPDLKKSGCDPEVVGKFLGTIGESVDKIADAGLKFMYHNHNMEFSHTADGQVLLDYIVSHFPAEKFGVTLDCYWVTAGGGDPAWWLRHLAGRVDCIHFKDMVWCGEDLAVRMAPVGDGNLNYPAIIEAAEEAGTKYAFVEQDNSYGEDEFVCLKRSIDHLRMLGCRD